MKGFVAGVSVALFLVLAWYVIFQRDTAGTLPAVIQSVNQVAPAQQPYQVEAIGPTNQPGTDLYGTAVAQTTLSAATAIAQATQFAPTAIPTLQTYGTYKVCMEGIFLYREPRADSEIMGVLHVGEEWGIVAMANEGQWLGLVVDGVLALWTPVVGYASCPQ